MYYVIEANVNGEWIHYATNGFLDKHKPELPFTDRDGAQAVVDYNNELGHLEFRLAERDWANNPKIVAFSNETFKFDGHEWRIRAIDDDLLYLEYDYFPFYIKVKPFAAKTYGITPQKTQVKCQYDAGWIVAFIRRAFYDIYDKPYGNANYGIAHYLNDFLNVRPTTPTKEQAQRYEIRTSIWR